MRQILIVLSAIAGVIFVTVVGAYFLGGAGKAPRGDEVSADVSRDAKLLVDDTAKAKGKTFTFKLSPAPSFNNETLRDFVGKDLEFTGYENNVKVTVTITIPHQLTVPNSTSVEKVLVTFTCTEGDLKRGNVATKIVRP